MILMRLEKLHTNIKRIQDIDEQKDNFIFPKTDLTSWRIELREYPNTLLIDASVFLFRNRFAFLIKLLDEEEILPEQVILADRLHYLLSTYYERRDLSDYLYEEFENIVSKWELGFNVKRAMNWISSKEFLEYFEIFFTKWKPLPAGEIIGYEKESNPLDINELREKLGQIADIVYDELKTAQHTRSMILCLSRGLTRLLKRLRITFIEIPHAKKKHFMKKHKFSGGLLFLTVFEVVKDNVSLSDIQNVLTDIVKNSSPSLQRFFTEINIPMSTLANWFLELITPVGVAIGTGYLTAAIVFDSISFPKKFFEP